MVAVLQHLSSQLDHSKELSGFDVFFFLPQTVGGTITGPLEGGEP